MKKIIYGLSFLLFTATIYAQNHQNAWSKIPESKATIGKKMLRKTEPSSAFYYHLNLEKFQNSLNFSSKKSNDTKTSQTILFPNSEGGLDSYKVIESSILEAEYQVKHPDIRTYSGFNINKPSSLIRFSITPNGLHSMALSTKNGAEFIDPYTNNNTYIVYKKGDLPSLKKQFQCLVEDNPDLKNKKSTASKNPADRKLRNFRIAIASTIEYSEFHWKAAGLNDADAEVEKKDAVLAAIVTTMNRVNTIFQRDLAIKMTLVDNSDIIFITEDNFSNNDTRELIDESQSVIDEAIGTANYDLGHTFSTGGGGLASLNSPCSPNRKASGITGLSNPVGDAYDIDFVAHELGHQFGAPHTFNGSTGNCAGRNRNAENAYEVGSGTTIMAYAGICTPQNVQERSDAYFHQKSIQMIWDNITTGISVCGEQININNNTPTADAGSDYTIPISTAFKLTGSSTDLDGTNTHTYTWEQYDLGPTGLPEETNTTGPLMRSFEGTSNPVRNIPRLIDYLASGGSSTWEKLPSINRSMTFALTVRDNDVMGTNGAGQTAVDFMTVTANSTDAFTVVNPASWKQGTTQTIEWNVGQTADVNTINCQIVNIKLSTDSGLTYPITIASNVPNNGTFSYNIPEMPDTTTARILIEAADNIFYDISDNDFQISDTPDFFLNNDTLNPILCDETEAVYNFDYVAVNDFNENVIFSATNLPNGAVAIFSPTNSTISQNITLTIRNLDNVPQNDYQLTLTGSSTTSTKTKNKNLDLPFFNSLCASSGNDTYDTSITGVEFNSISTTSGKTGYTDFTGMVADVNRNSAYDISVSVDTAGNWTTSTLVWIDWNQDCDFDDQGELYDLGTALNVEDEETSLSPLSIVIPEDAVLGNTIMRISTKYNGEGVPEFCGVDFDGEVEDYTVNVQPVSLSTRTFNSADFNVSPNPNNGNFNVSLNGSIVGDVVLEVYNISGQLITQKSYNSTGSFNQQVNLEFLSTGLYILKISDDSKSANKKLVIN